MQKRNVLNSPRLSELKKHRRRIILDKILISLLGFSAIFILLIYLSHLNSLNISEVDIVGNKVIDMEAIKTAVQEQIAGKYLEFFPKTNILFYPENSIKNELRNKFKRIKDINLSIENNRALLVSLSEREAKYTWCGLVTPELNSNSNQKCYFMDEGGYIFDEAPYFSGNVYFKFYGDESMGNLPGAYFLKDRFAKIIEFKNIVENLGLKPISFWLDNLGDASFFLSSQSAPGPAIIFKIDDNYEKIAENLETALTTEPLQSKFKNEYSSLEYIDLRFENKVYDKFLEKP
jgi:hypothetical protein